MVSALVWISIALGGLAAAAPVAWSIPSLIAPRNSLGKVGGILNLSGQIAAISAPIVTGYVLSLTGTFYAAFAAAAVLILIGIGGYAFLLGRIDRIPDRVGCCIE